MTHRPDTEAVVARLREAIRDLVLAVESRLGERCPCRAADDACAFPARCRNQVPRDDDPGRLRCGGDRQLTWTRQASRTERDKP